MNDKELLELAAKAVDLVDIDWLAGDGYMNVYDTEGHQYAWNPLTDDGDALRLAIKLDIAFVISKTSNIVKTLAGDVDTGYFGASEYINNDPYAATRRAIVRVAAEIGKGIK